ncbi:hypothetical protein GGX14DRAFT_470778, partial [Mycena pura]
LAALGSLLLLPAHQLLSLTTASAADKSSPCQPSAFHSSGSQYCQGSPLGSSLPFGNTVANYVELAAIVIPPGKHGLRDRLRRACGFLPMPLALGWDADPRDEEAPQDSTVPGLMLSDIGSGATRLVTAHWMHALYKHTLEKPPGTIVMFLREAGYTTHFGWPHALILGAFLLQLAIVPVVLARGQRREGLLLLVAALIRICEGAWAWAFPQFRPPRADRNRLAPRYCALHTGMTTTHIVVVTHREGYRGPCVVLEDAAAPQPSKADGWWRTVEDSTRAALKVAVWIQKGAALITAANGYAIPAVLLFGTVVIQLIAATFDTLPSRAVTLLATGNSLLDRLTAACQFSESVSVGFVESLLPDPRANHTDYVWISQAMQQGRCRLCDFSHSPSSPSQKPRSNRIQRIPQQIMFCSQPSDGGGLGSFPLSCLPFSRREL